jgi:hypothetical protein
LQHPLQLLLGQPATEASSRVLLGTGDELGRWVLVQASSTLEKQPHGDDYSTTVDVYSHMSRERSRVAAARIDGRLKRRETPLEAAQ